MARCYIRFLVRSCDLIYCHQTVLHEEVDQEIQRQFIVQGVEFRDQGEPMEDFDLRQHSFHPYSLQELHFTAYRIEIVPVHDPFLTILHVLQRHA